MHLPKCGGTSVAAAYTTHARPDDIIINSRPSTRIYRKRLGLSKHSSVREIVEAIGEEAYSQLTVFSLVRNPYRMYESFFTYSKKICSINATKRKISLEQLLEDIRNERSDAGIGHRPWGKAFAHSANFSEFVMYFRDRERPIWRLAHRQLSMGNANLRPTQIYKLEEIQSFWPVFSKAAGIELNPKHTNKSVQEKLEWGKPQREFVAEMHQGDFEHFGYPIDD